MREEVICEHCTNPTTTFKTIHIETTPFTGCRDCMDELVDMYNNGTYTLADYIKDLKE